MFSFVPFDGAVARRFASDPPDLRRRARLISAFGVLGVVGATLLSVTHLAWLDIPLWYALVPVAGGVVSLAASVLVQRRKALRLAAHLCAACWLGVTGWGLFLRGGLLAAPLMCAGAAPFIATALLGKRAGLIWCLPVLVELLVLLALRQAGVPVPDRIPEQYRLFSDVLAAVLFGTMLVAMGQAQEWLRARATGELLDSERLKVAAQHEIELARADRLSSLGQMAAGVAHELNNPLAYVLANLELLAEQPLTTASGDLVRDAIDGVDRLKVIVRDLKDYSRFDDDLTPVALEGVVRAGVRLARGELKRVDVRTELGACPLVQANEARLGQVVVNLLVNASQAGAKEISVSTLTDHGGNAVLAVRDTGQGIPAELIRKVREPFFTTKPAGLGTGLGLSVCDQLVRQLGGVMTIESAVGVGTTVTLILPPAPVPEEALSAWSRAAAARPPTGS